MAVPNDTSDSVSLKDLLQEMQRMNTGIQDIRTSQQKLFDDNEEVKGALHSLQSTLPEMKTQLGKNTKQLYSLEREKRRKNLVIFNMQEDEGEKITDVEHKVCDLIVNQLMLTDFSLSRDVDYCRRLGKVDEKRKIRPILLALVTERKKYEILRNCNKLKISKISIRDDIPEELRPVRKELVSQMKKLRAEGKVVTLVYDKLVVRDEPQTQKQSQKRALSQSPGNPAKIQRSGNPGPYNSLQYEEMDLSSTQEDKNTRSDNAGASKENTEISNFPSSRSTSNNRPVSSTQPSISQYMVNSGILNSQKND